MMPSEEASDEYSRLLQDADYENTLVDQAELKYAKQNARYQQTRGFLGFSCDARCNREYQVLQTVQGELKEAKAAQFKALSQAKGKVGVFSVYAVQEARDLFWGSMGQGKAFAKRASMWDLLFMGLGSMGRDEGLVSFLFRLALNVLMNFTMGLIGATVAFIWYLWDVIKSYQPDPVTGEESLRRPPPSHVPACAYSRVRCKVHVLVFTRECQSNLDTLALVGYFRD